ncbi:hypothetical protein HanRHA438_Chr16g0759431 [Helianthus annuus]|uniref:Uncharacterized protein n=1 Tax=Helianthus annuus TaxID=4232 RepID=A0A251RZ19_HELAN|nr:hypothetical protein HanHA300_Chr16g0609881 [Helianthus annuus]KAJ0460406.1 hypothetical protein HanHA89_Chr16g0660471 [Helianthus annuus]KAJ0640847.1 hypothetical protein HanLR1_Chr16g0620391 [Helianthus annuus]KAJ0644763.1 hypothetical protein HanOQP8_Chr16g0616021 [Helianthus annuus]KAJ0835790.1 hypothetical protein HanRHA438_Chr16g0759431 [Helianthus annuus]
MWKDTMWKDKSPGVKILWVWTIGTAAVLVANVATSRVSDMNKIINVPEESSSPPVDQQTTDSIITGTVLDSSLEKEN